MLIVRDLLSLVMVILNISIKASRSERKIGFNLIFEKKVESILDLLKADNGSDLEKSGDYHFVVKVKCICRTFSKIKGWDEHVGVVLRTSS